MQLFQNICYLDLGEGEAGRLEQVAAGGAALLAGVARRKAWPAVEKCFMKLSIIADLSVVTVLTSLSAMSNWEEVFLFSMDFSVPKHFGISATGSKFLLGKLRLSFSN